jgi:hypothetical protein
MNHRKVKLTIIVLIAAMSALYMVVIVAGIESSTAAAPEQRQRKKARTSATDASEPSRDYLHFTHQVAQHKGQACDGCHKFPTANWKTVRKADAAIEDVTDYPQHASCLGCHRQQFFSGAVPTICRVCHVDPSPRNSTRFPFPNPRELFDASPKGQAEVSEYAVYFPHDKHEGVFGHAQPNEQTDHTSPFVAVAFHQDKAKDDKAKDKAPQESCANCHQTYQPQGDADDEYVTKAPKNLPDTAFWLKKGTFKTAPQGHTMCFTCHSADMKPAPSDCGTCHKLLSPEQAAARKAAHADFDPKTAATMGISDKTTLAKWGRREAVKFRHEWFSHAELSCASCHNTAALNTLNEKGPSVAVLSCGGSGCHITKTTDDGGALNAEADQKKAAATFQCTKCHAQLGKQPIPPSHLKAIAAIKDKP